PSTINANGAAISACGIKAATTALPGTLTVNATTCVISGTPTATLSSTTYTLNATNSVGASVDATVSLSVAAGVPSLSYASSTGTPATPTRPSSDPPSTINANGAAISACGIKAATTALPGTLTVNATTCVISGTPTATLSS